MFNGQSQHDCRVYDNSRIVIVAMQDNVSTTHIDLASVEAIQFDPVARLEHCATRC